MQLSLSFSVLLGSLFVLSTLPDNVHAIPLTSAQTGLVTLPLKRIPARENVHPQLLLQQHINRSHRRLARMTGRGEPSSAELAFAIAKRADGLRRPARVGYPGSGLKGHGRPTSVSSQDFFSQFGGNAEDESPIASSTQATASADDSSAGISPLDVAAANSETLTPANAPADADTLGLDIDGNDTGYVATVQIGTPPRDFKLLMDSGSADFWVGAENCQSEGGGGCGNHVFLGPLSSSSFVDTNQPFQVSYGSGNVAGDIITDNVAIAGLQLNAHTFGVANTESVDFSSDQVPFDGLMGLAQSTLSEQQTLTPVESLAKAGLIKAPITSFKISRLADQKNDGEVTFGGLDSSKFDAQTLTNIPNVNQNGFWEGAIDAVTADGQDLQLSGRTAILDTGTTLFIAPPADAEALLQTIPGAKEDGQGGFTVPCNTTTSIALTFGGQEFAIDPRDLAFLPVDQNNLDGDCVSGISAGQIGGATEWLLGDVFLKSVYFSTNVADNSISLAKLV
ncbi:acid protease [Artomyces pyxidatus]|uniref:Acid protease n=1 Tax=Artomyces pyxidatus TaxID=48021 RepID=A0ACB8SRR6_9AGAM|nr:acid protease [Artomyces pyxidatus]